MWKWTQRTFAGGQQDLTLAGRQDLATYFTSARTLENFLVKRQGCISKRRGTELVANLDGLFGDGYKITHARAIPFVYERDGGYVLLFVEGAYIEESGETTEDSEVKRCIVVCSTKGILHTDDNDATSWHHSVQNTDTVSPSTIDIPYRGEEFDDIGYTQSGDTLFIAHEKYPFATLKRINGEFKYEVVDFYNLGNDALPDTPIIQTIVGSNFPTNGSNKSVEYCVTAVKDGIESAPSSPYKFTYNLPWNPNASVKITVVKPKTMPDHFNIYKRDSSSWGIIGSTSSSVVAVKTKPTSTTQASFCLAPNWIKESVSPPYDKNYPLVGTATNTNYGYGRLGYVFNNGVIDITYAEPVFIDEIEFNVGNVFAAWASGSSPTAYVQFVPCKAVVFKCEVTFADETSETFNSPGFSQTYQRKDVPSSWYGGPWGTAWANAISDTAKSFGQNQFVTATIYSSDVDQTKKKKVKSIKVTGYADTEMTTVATGSISGAYIISVNDNPVVLNGIRMITHGVSMNVFEDDYITPDVSLTPPVNEPHFEAFGKYPACVALGGQRLVLAATDDQPFTLWMSTVGDLYNFNTHDSIREDDAIEATIPATEFPEINHIVSAKNLIVLCDNGEWVVRPTSGNTISYKTIEIKQQSQIGCSKRLPPLPVADELIFAESTSETLRAMKYDWTSDGYQSADLSVLSQSLTRNNPIVDYAYKQHPDSIIVCVLQDGTIATLTYMKEHEVCAWSTARLGGGLKAVGICTDKAIRGGTTDLYILAADESGVYSLLRVREDSPAATVEESLCLDAMQIDEVTKETTLVGEKVAVDLLTGEETKTLSANRRYAVGYPYTATFRSVTPEAQGQNTIQFELKGAKSAELRLENASAFKIIPSALEDESDADTNYWTTCGDNVEVVDGKVTYSAQDHFVALAGDANTSGAITLKSDSPWPMSLLSYSIHFEFDPRLLGQNG
jgi:hypothetical protein